MASVFGRLRPPAPPAILAERGRRAEARMNRFSSTWIWRRIRVASPRPPSAVQLRGCGCAPTSSSSAYHTTAYSKEEQQVYSWGWGDFGRLGHGNSSDVFTAQPVKALLGIQIKQLACGDSHCVAITMSGEVQRIYVSR